MSQEEFPVEFIMDSVQAIMAPIKQPKAFLFDIGGVCVISPMQAILDYETSKGIPPGYVNYCIAKTKPNGFWHRLERGEDPMDAAWFQGFTAELNNTDHWTSFYTEKLNRSEKVPPLPHIDGEWLFWSMMRASQEPDPWMYPALKSLKASGKFLLAACSNTVIFPEGHPYNSRGDLKSLFDVFVSSAHVGIRKPERTMYEHTLAEINKFAKENASTRGKRLGWEQGIRPEDVVFLDDIGENLKAGREIGFGTIKVPLGRTYEAVDELEKMTGLKLAGDHPRIPVLPKAKL
ncbi:putative epoxide hydrolase [Xylogone sp. PMI_703]|nr:putative epoxide hydrolase [Xylogone sp. PMI_703]